MQAVASSCAFSSETKHRRPRKAIQVDQGMMKNAFGAVQQRARMPLRPQQRFKGSQASMDAFEGFVPSEQMALKRSDNEQWLPWTTL